MLIEMTNDPMNFDLLISAFLIILCGVVELIQATRCSCSIAVVASDDCSTHIGAADFALLLHLLQVLL